MNFGAVGTKFGARPALLPEISVGKKKSFLIGARRFTLFGRSRRNNHQSGARLTPSGEIEKILIRNVAVYGVASGRFSRGKEHERAAIEGVRQFFAASTVIRIRLTVESAQSKANAESNAQTTHQAFSLAKGTSLLKERAKHKLHLARRACAYRSGVNGRGD